jgi:methionine-rich copper-binding protein CopC
MTFRVLCLAPVLATLAAAPALANATLVLANPAPRAVVAMPPQMLVLSFSVPPQMGFSEITVTNAAGDPIPAGRPEVVNGQPFELAVPVRITLPGRYTVNWEIRAYSQRSTGHYSFTVTQ